MTGKSIFVTPNKIIKEGKIGLRKIKSNGNDDFLFSLKSDAVRLQNKRVTEDGVKIPLNFKQTYQIRRKVPEKLFEPVDIAKPKERIVTTEEFDRQLIKLEQAEEKE